MMTMMVMKHDTTNMMGRLMMVMEREEGREGKGRVRVAEGAAAGWASSPFGSGGRAAVRASSLVFKGDVGGLYFASLSLAGNDPAKRLLRRTAS